MASVVGHALAGIITKEAFCAKPPSTRGRILLGLSILAAIIPDFDVVFYIVFKPSNMIAHRGLSHGLPFALIVASIFTVLATRYLKMSRIRLFLVFFLSLCSHIALDYLMGAGPPVPLFSPFSDRAFLCPIKLVPTAFYATSASGLLGILYYTPAIVGYCLEIWVFVPIIYLVKKREKRLVLLFTSLSGMITTYLIYN